MVILAAFMVGGYFGSMLALELSPNTMRKTFSSILILIALKMFLMEKTA